MISVKTCGYSSRWLAVAWTSSRAIRCRFFTAIEMTSIALHAASADTTVSTGLPPWFDARSSKSIG